MKKILIKKLKMSLLNLSVILMVSLSGLAWAEVVWIDVRSSLEHAVDNIEGDIRISHNEIVERVSEQFPDKNTTIHLYCRSGGRAGIAMSSLQQAGYSDVKNMGSIGDAREERGL